MSDSVGQIDLDLRVNERGFNRQMNGIAGNAQGVVGGAFKKLGFVIAGAFAIHGMVRFGNSAIKLASDLAEVQNVVDVTFGKMSTQVNSFSKNAINSFGLSELSAKKFTSTMGAMLKSSGLTGQGMTNMSIGVTKLAGDMASFYNLDGETAFAKIRSGLSGETEPLKQLGVNMSVANMEAYALAEGIGTSYKNMDQASKTLLRYNYLLSVTGDAQGDFARTSGSWANQVKIMGEQWNTFKASMGQGFINVLTPVLKGLNWLITKLQVAAQYFQAFTALLFGSAKAPASMGVAAKATASATAGATSSNDKLAKSTGAVGSAAKKASADIKGSLSGFDQLNVIGKDASASMAGAGGSTGGAGGGLDAGGGAGAMPVPDFATPEINTDILTAKLQPLKDMLDALIKPLQAIDFGPLAEAFDRLKKAVAPITKGLFAGLSWAYFNIFVPIAKWTIEDFLPAFLDLLSGAMSIINPILSAFKPLAVWFLESFLLPIGSWTGGIIVDVLKGFADVLETIGSWMSEHSAFVSSALIGMSVALGLFALSTWGVAIAVGAANIVLGIFTGAIAFLTSPITLIIAGIAALVAAFVYFYKTNEGFKGVVDKVFDSIKDVLSNLWKNVLVPLGKFLKDVFVSAWDVIVDVATWLWKEVLVPLGDFLIWIWKNVLVPIGGILEDVLGVAFEFVADVAKSLWKNVLVPLGEFFTETFGPAVEAIQTVFKSLWDNALKPLGAFLIDVFKGQWDKIVVVLQFLWYKVLKPIAEYLSGGFMTAFDTVFGLVGTVIDTAKEVFAGFLEFITGVFSGDWEKAWDGIKTIFTGIMGGIVDIFKGIINGVIDGINYMTKAINKIKIKLPDIPNPLGGDPLMEGFSVGVPQIPQIPRLANGGLVSAPTLAMVGDNKGASTDPEVITPLSKLKDMLGNNDNTMVVEALMMVLDAIEKLNLNIELDGEKLGRTLYPYMDKEKIRKGSSSIITVGGM